MRVLMTADAVGGVWTFALDLASGLASAGDEVVIATLGPLPSSEQMERARTIPGLQVVPTGLPLDWMADCDADVARSGDQIARVANLAGASLIHLNSPALAARSTFPAPVVATSHSCMGTWWKAVRGGDLPDGFSWRSSLHGKGMRRADACTTPSHAFARLTQEAHGIAKPIVIRNGRRSGSCWTAAPKKQRFIFTAGRLWDAGKNIETLDAAASRLDVPVIAAGSSTGPGGDSIRVHSIRCIGNLDDAGMRNWLDRAPIFASVARYEPFGLAVLEAAQAGCALVLSDIPTFRELWDGAARFVEPGSAEALAATVDDLLDDEDTLFALGRAARERSRSYTLDAMVAGYRALYGAAPARMIA